MFGLQQFNALRGKPVALYKKIRLISSCLKSWIFIPLIQKMRAYFSLCGVEIVADSLDCYS